jgi:ABC-type nickel/cobalt efflux system permease component RcnA
MPAFVTRLLAAAAVMLALVAIVATPPPAEAQPLGKPPPGAAQPAPAAGSSFLDRIWTGIVTAQRDLTNAMTGAVKRLKASGSVSATALLAFVSFVYGVLHAVGPGHGKFVISSYALASERTVRRSLLLSAMAAAVQAISAIVIVGAFAIILGATSLEIRAAEGWLETASWALIAALGAWLLWRQLAALRLSAAHAGHHAHSDHDHEGRHHGHAHADHEHEHHHHDQVCGHVHFADPGLLGGAWSWRQAWSLALSIGIRPCTGAIAVLLFALSIGMFWAGVFATFAMAAGTALTVSALAVIAVGSREFASRLAGRESQWAIRIEQAAGITGAALVLLIGATFFAASLISPVPL